jgi:arylsulfatase
VAIHGNVGTSTEVATCSNKGIVTIQKLSILRERLSQVNKRKIFFAIAISIVANFSLADGKPNIVVMMTDNQGYGDLDIYGGVRAETPNIDELAADGVLFKDFQVEPGCTQTRAAFMTGRMPIRSGTDDYAVPGHPGGLHPKEVTLAELMKGSGYATALYGKWHLGDIDSRFPQMQGFDEWFGIANTSSPISPELPGINVEELLPQSVLEARAGKKAKFVQSMDMEYRGQMDRELAKKSSEFIKRNALSGKPFFLLTTFINPHYPVVPHPEFKGKSKGGAYTDVLMEIDYNVGMILEAIDEAGIRDNTIVVFFSDNGADRFHHRPDHNGDNGPWTGELGSAWEGGLRTPAMMRWPGKIREGWRSNEMIHVMDLFVTLGNIAGADLPDDRPIDGFDQTEYLIGNQEDSARDHRLVFYQGKLLAVRYNQYKAHLVVYDKKHSITSAPHDLGRVPYLYNIVTDPKEEFNLLGEPGGASVTALVMGKAAPYYQSFRYYPNNDYTKIKRSR